MKRRKRRHTIDHIGARLDAFILARPFAAPRQSACADVQAQGALKLETDKWGNDAQAKLNSSFAVINHDLSSL
jgi:hypothetical protein